MERSQSSFAKHMIYNKAIKVTRYTRRFWYEVQCALLVQCGAPYCRRYAFSRFKGEKKYE